MTEQKGTPAKSLGKEDLVKIGKGSLIAIGSVALTAATIELGVQLQYLSDQIDFGTFESVSVVVFAALINGIRKWATSTNQDK